MAATRCAPAGREARHRRGFVLVAIATIGAVLVVLGLGLVQLGFHARSRAVATVAELAARAAADAGLVHAKFMMNKKLAEEVVWNNGTLPVAAGVALAGSDSTYDYTIAGGPANFLVTATGTSGYRQRQVFVSLGVGSYWEGIGVKEGIDIKLGTAFGSLPSATAGLTIRSNSIVENAIIFKASVTVPGDVVCGPGGDPNLVIDTKATTVIEGQTYAAPEELLFPPVLPPAGLPYRGVLNASGAIMASGMYDSISVPAGGLLTIGQKDLPAGHVDVYVTGKFTLGNGSMFIVKPGTSLNLYLGGNLEDKNSSGVINQTNDATALRIYGLPTCTQVDLKAKSALYGAVYAPNANVNLYNNGDFYGSIVGNSFIMKNSGTFIYDTRLGNLGINDPAAAFTVLRWWEN